MVRRERELASNHLISKHFITLPSDNIASPKEHACCLERAICSPGCAHSHVGSTAPPIHVATLLDIYVPPESAEFSASVSPPPLSAEICTAFLPCTVPCLLVSAK